MAAATSTNDMALMRDLREAVTLIGLDALTEISVECDPGALTKFIEILKKLADDHEGDAQASPTTSHPDIKVADGANDDGYSVAPLYDSENIHTSDTDNDDGGYLDVDDFGVDDYDLGDVVTNAETEVMPNVEVNVSNEAFRELFPTKAVTKKQYFPGSFPNIDDFEGGFQLIGKGFSGLAFKSVFKGTPVVLKVSRTKSEASNRDDYREWSISEKLRRHPNVLEIIGLCPSFEIPFPGSIGTTALISPLQENGGLRTFFDKRDRRDGDVADIAFGMIAGIRSLHEQRVVHRDIAVRNFLVDIDGRVLLCDFGLTEFLPEGEDFLHTKNLPAKPLPWRYLAPESLAGVFSTKSDIWMFGLSLIELMNSEVPWHTYDTPAELSTALKMKTFVLPDMTNYPPIIAEVIRDCLLIEAADRPTANDVAEKLVRSQFAAEDADRDEDGNTKLQRLLLAGKNFQVRKLLKKRTPIMVNAVNKLGETPLLMANAEYVRSELLAYRKLAPGNTEPSADAEYSHNVDVFGALVSLAESVDVEGVNALGEAMRSEYYEVVVSDEGDHEYRKGGDTPLHIAAKSRNAALFDALLELGILDPWKVNGAGRSVLHAASAHGNVLAIEKLIHRLEDEAKESGGTAAGAGASMSLSTVNLQDKLGKTALHLAAASDDASTTKALLNCQAVDVNQRDANGQTPIFDSISGTNRNSSAKIAVLEALLGHSSVDMNVADSRGETIMHKVARGNFDQIAEVLLRQKTLRAYDQDTEHLYTPLHVAILEQNFDIASRLLSYEGLDINQVDKYGNTPLHLLSKTPTFLKDNDSVRTRSSDLEAAIQQLATAFTSRTELDVNVLNVQKNTPLHEAAKAGNIIVARMLISRPEIKPHAPNKWGDTPLHEAAAQNSAGICEALLSLAGVDVNTKNDEGRTPLHHAAEKNALEAATALLSRRDVDVNAEDDKERTPLHLAALKGCGGEVAAALLSRNDIDVNARCQGSKTPLNVAARADNVGVARVLVARPDVDVVACDKMGRTPLHDAANGDSVEVAKMLLSRQAVDVNGRDNDGETPIHACLRSYSHEVAGVIMSRSDADLNARDNRGLTPLHRAVNCRGAELVTKMLLSRRDVDVNARDKEGLTPLHRAVGVECLEVAGWLLSRDDVDVDARDDNGKTALEVACSPEAFAELLRNVGRKSSGSEK